jgi:hypothetical protein
VHRSDRALTISSAAVAGALLALQLGHVISRAVAGYAVVAIFGVATFASLARRRAESNEVVLESAVPDWLDVSERLIEFVQGRGNVVYVWGDELGGGFAILRAALERPPDIEFDEVLHDPFRLRLASDIDPAELRLRYRSWPREKILVDAGQFAGEGGGGVDGS